MRLRGGRVRDERRVRDMRELREIRHERFRRLDLERKWAHGRWSKLDSKVYAAALKLEELAFSDGALSKKQKELIALGIGVITDCESCMQWHMAEAAKVGASRAEIVEALEVAIEMGVVPATVHARFALGVLDSLFPEAPSPSRPTKETAGPPEAFS